MVQEISNSAKVNGILARGSINLADVVIYLKTEYKRGPLCECGVVVVLCKLILFI